MYRHTLIFHTLDQNTMVSVEIDLKGEYVTPRCFDQIEACVECEHGTLAKTKGGKAAHIWLRDGVVRGGGERR